MPLFLTASPDALYGNSLSHYVFVPRTAGLIIRTPEKTAGRVEKLPDKG
jgi:hypothetical protein